MDNAQNAQPWWSSVLDCSWLQCFGQIIAQPLNGESVGEMDQSVFLLHWWAEYDRLELYPN